MQPSSQVVPPRPSLLVALLQTGPQSALHVALTSTAVRHLYHHGADLEALDDGGMTALTLRAYTGHEGAVMALLQCGADPRNRDGWETALHEAALEGRLQIAQWLLEAGADVDAGNDNSETPLMMSAVYCHLDVFELLLRWGADPERRGGDLRAADVLLEDHGDGPEGAGVVAFLQRMGLLAP